MTLFQKLFRAHSYSGISEILFAVFVTAVFVSFSSCRKESLPSPPEPEVKSPEFFTYVYVDSQVLYFRRIQGQKTEKFSKENITDLFGRRVEWATPQKIQLTKDSIVIQKKNDIEEKFKYKWDGNDLLLLRSDPEQWLYAGEKLEDGRLFINTVFFIERSADSQRFLSNIGQDYSLVSYEGLPSTSDDKAASSYVWLQMHFIFKKTTDNQ
ncbi:MAG TPA: hypothetical protein DEF88_14060 [Porphyromonadaceae bacterium]|nr:hypothetical protein [Porphyromonadaceae bacterium]HCM21280.1 hypothetical protein [Porphyromonadaceae bacterium]